MSSITKLGLKSAFVDSFITQLKTGQSRYYYCLGKNDPWPDDNAPPAPLVDDQYEAIVRSDIITAKRIGPLDVSRVIRRINWEAGKIYDIYDDKFTVGVGGATEQKDSDFYVMNSQFNVYKCLSNNNGRASTKEPYGIDLRPFTLSDGYQWKYIYSLSAAARNKFMTNDFIPIENPLSADYYRRGTITSVSVRAIGSDYVDGANVVVQGDGFLENNPFRIESIDVDTNGSGYLADPIVTIQSPFATFTTWTAGASALLGEITKHENNFYRVVKSGVYGSTPPTHYEGTVDGATGIASLEYAGTQAFADAIHDAGQIGSIKVTDPGIGYPNAPSVSITGGGGTGATATTTIDAGTISSVLMTSFGSGYTSLPTVSFAEPYDLFNAGNPLPNTYVLWTSNGSASAGQLYKFSDVDGERYYRADSSGTFDNAGPVHISGSALNGSVLLTFVAKRAVGVAVRGRVTDINLIGYVGSIDVEAAGNGYTQDAKVAIVGTGTGAAANVIIDEFTGQVIDVVVTAIGSGYDNTTTAVIYEGTVPSFVADFTGNSYMTQSSEEALSVGSGAVLKVNVEYGYGYASNPMVDISAPNDVNGIRAEASTDGNKTNAIIKAVVENGTVVGVDIIDGGVGYTFASLTVAGGNGDAKLEPLIDSGKFISAQSNNQLLAVPGTVSGVVITNPGLGYSSVSVIIDGDGTGAQATANVVNGSIDSITITDPGQGYSFADVSLSGVGSGFVGRVIISPPKGHGSNPVSELFTSSVATYTSLSDETNQGLVVNNDYRQVSILKDPLQFSENLVSQDIVATTCFLATLDYSGSQIELDDIMYRLGDNARLIVVAISGRNYLLKEIDNTNLSVEDELYVTKNGNDIVVSMTRLEKPTFDKFSGDMVFIDNVSPFNFNETQTISIRTIVNL